MQKLNLTWPDKSENSRGAFSIVKKLQGAGHEALIAGGAVRDALLRRKIGDIDIATSATPSQVEKLFAKTIPTGKKHGTITVRLNHISYEVTTFRSEGRYEDVRRPKTVQFITNAEKDAQRRDFTVNALFYDPIRSEVIDYVEGIADLKRRVINIVGDSGMRIREDALRLMRGVRFASLLDDFELSRETRKAIKSNAKLLKKISVERVKQELDKIMLSGRASIGISLLDVVGLLEFILPELKKCQGVKQQKNYHSEGDVYTHSLLALENADKSCDLATRYAILLHDVGKTKTIKMRGGKLTFHDHPEAGAALTKNICRRLKFPKNEELKIVWLVRYHMVIFTFNLMRLGTRRKWALSPYFGDLLKMNQADNLASFRPSGKGERTSLGYNAAVKAWQEVSKNQSYKKPIISGNTVMKILKIESGPLVGKVLKQIEDWRLSNKLKTKNDARNLLRAKKNYFSKLK